MGKPLWRESGLPVWDALTRIPERRILGCGGNRQIHTDYRSPVEKKGRHGHSLSERERAPTLAWAGFYCFSGYITSRMVLIYHAQVHCR